MQIVYNNTAFDSPREKLKKYFSRGDLFFSRDIHLCFVCGAAGECIPGSDDKSLRSIFLSHVAARSDVKITCVRAETAATELLRQIDERGQNISVFEKTIAETVDSVLIFPESPGSFAELGYFSAHDDISRKCLVAIRARHQENSFITLGPIHAISRISIFSPVPIVIADPPEMQMIQIADRLLGESARKRAYRQRYQRQQWKDYDSRQQLALVDEIVDLIGASTEVDLRHLIKDIFEQYDISKLRLQLSILVAAGRIERNDDGDIFARPRLMPFMEQGSQENIAIKAAWRRAFQLYAPDVLKELEAVQ